MKITVVDKVQGAEGWIFLPVKNGKAKKVGAKPPMPGLPLAKDDWEASTEFFWQKDGQVFFKAAPTKTGIDAAANFQEALGKGLRQLSSRKVKSAVVILPEFADISIEILSAIFEVPDLMNFDISPYKTKPEAKKPFTLKEITFVTPDRKQIAAFGKQLGRVRKIMEGVNFARRLVDEPGNVMTPTALANAALTLKKNGVKVSLLAEKNLQKMGGVQAVSAGSAQPPHFIVMELNPGKQKPVVLVGKGVTFDTGGISIKPADLMWEMKNDMAGGAAVIGAMKALANLGCKRRVLGLVPTVENMPGGWATKPGDVITLYDGQTVEVLNTDAEGRLILADALGYAAAFSPEYIVDLATLTGAIVVALGPRFAGLFCNESKLQKEILEAAKSGSELVWPMPLHPSFLEEMKSPFADWKNVAGRKGGACTAAAFLSAFVKCPWAHLDIAAPAIQEKEKPFSIKGGGTGVGVRLLTNLVMGGQN